VPNFPTLPGFRNSGRSSCGAAPHLNRQSWQAQNLEAYYPCVGAGTQLLDLSGHERHGTKHGAPSVVVSGAAGGVAVDLGTHAQAYYYTAPIPDMSTFTLSVDVVIGAISGTVSGQAVLSLVASDDQRVTLAADNSPDDWGAWDNVNSWLRSGQAQQVGERATICLVYDGTTNRRVYYNGVLQATDSSVSAIVSGKTTLYIGAEDPTALELWDGLVFNIRVISRAYTDGEVYEMYRNPSALLQRRNIVTVQPAEAASGFQPFWAQNATITQSLQGMS